jgi:hypothetical protein
MASLMEVGTGRVVSCCHALPVKVRDPSEIHAIAWRVLGGSDAERGRLVKDDRSNGPW